MKKHRGARLGLIVAVLSVAISGCVPEYEFLKMPRAGLKAGSRWKVGLGPISDGPAAGAGVSEKAQGLDWLNDHTERKGGADLQSALAGLFSAGLNIDARLISNLEIEGLVHQQVINPESLPRGYAYLWETIEAARIKITLDRSLETEIQGRIDRFSASDLGQKLNLQFKAEAGSKGTYQVTGRNLVVAVKVVEFRTNVRTETVTVRLGKDFQGADQAGAFGYMVSVQSGGVDLPARRAEVLLRNPRALDPDAGAWKGALGADAVRIHLGPIVGEKCDVAVDTVYISGWDADNLACQVTFQRSTWTLRQVGCGLDTVR
ncbi:MAG TPA: hypothetical protein PK280_12420 [Planctomycetota bacterium]|nr:hypothetical protein [Planctomycetota bacterium]